MSRSSGAALDAAPCAMTASCQSPLRFETMVIQALVKKAASRSAWEADMAQNGTRATGPRCIALVGPFQSGKTTLLEAILARTGAIRRQGTVEAGTTVGDASKEARHHVMSVELSRRHHHLHGRQLYFHRLSRLGRVRARHARGAARGRRGGRGLRDGREEDSAAPAHPARARRPEDPALPVPQQDRQGRHHDPRRAQAVAAGVALEAAAAADPDILRRAHHRLRRPRARARLCLQGARAVRGRAARRRRARRARRPRASPCWRRSPTTTTS